MIKAHLNSASKASCTGPATSASGPLCLYYGSQVSVSKGFLKVGLWSFHLFICRVQLWHVSFSFTFCILFYHYPVEACLFSFKNFSKFMHLCMYFTSLLQLPFHPVLLVTLCHSLLWHPLNPLLLFCLWQCSCPMSIKKYDISDEIEHLQDEKKYGSKTKLQ